MTLLEKELLDALKNAARLIENSAFNKSQSPHKGTRKGAALYRQQAEEIKELIAKAKSQSTPLPEGVINAPVDIRRKILFAIDDFRMDFFEADSIIDRILNITEKPITDDAIERAARAICKVQFSSWEECNDWQMYLREAKAALEAAFPSSAIKPEGEQS